MSYKGNSETEIIEGCKKKVREAQNALYKLYYGKLNAISYRYLSSFDDAKDIVHDSFIHAFEKITSFEGNGSIEGWLRRIVVNKSIDFLNRRNKHFINVNEEEERILNDKYSAYLDNSNTEESNLSLESIYSSGLTHEDIINAVNLLKDSYKVIFNLSVIDGYSHKNISEVLGISEESSRVRLKRGRMVLQAILIDIAKKKRNDNLNKN